MPALLDSNLALDRMTAAQADANGLAGAALDVLEFELEARPSPIAPLAWEEEEEDEEDDDFLDDEDDLDLGEDDEEFVDDDDDDEDFDDEEEEEADEEE